MTVIAKKQPQTKLSFKLRRACDKAEKTPPEHEDAIVLAGKIAHARRSAADLDVAAFSLGARGERVKSLASYGTAKRAFESLTGEPYAD